MKESTSFLCSLILRPNLLPIVLVACLFVISMSAAETGCNNESVLFATIAVLTDVSVACRYLLSVLIRHLLRMSHKTVADLASCSFDKHTLILIIFGLLLLLVCVSFTIISQPRNSVFIRRV